MFFASSFVKYFFLVVDCDDIAESELAILLSDLHINVLLGLCAQLFNDLGQTSIVTFTL